MFREVAESLQRMFRGNAALLVRAAVRPPPPLGGLRGNAAGLEASAAVRPLLLLGGCEGTPLALRPARLCAPLLLLGGCRVVQKGP